MIRSEEVGRIVFGCGNIGGLGSDPALRDNGDPRERALTLLDRARELGITRFDTANTYGGGLSERVLGEWLGRQGNGFRARAEIATKVGNPAGCPPGERPLSGRQVALHLDESLRRLRVEQISLYYLHEFDRATPLEETFAAIDAAARAGKIAAFGVSNAMLGDLEAVAELARQAPGVALTHVQNGFNRLETADGAALIAFAQASGLKYVAFSPLAGGLLTGKYRSGAPAAADSRLAAAPDFYAHLLNPETFAAIEGLKRQAQANGWTTSGAALRFVLDYPGVDSLIIAPRSVEQFAAYGIAAA